MLFFFAYFIQYIPQIIHNIKHKEGLTNISVLTQFSIFITTLCDIIVIVGFGYDWRYAVVAISYLLGVCIQQLQITFLSKKVPEIVNLFFIILFAVAMLNNRLPTSSGSA